MSVTLIYIILIITVIRLLDATSRRCIETRHGKTDSRAVRKVDRLLHEALSERASADDDSPVVILDGSGEDFA